MSADLENMTTSLCIVCLNPDVKALLLRYVDDKDLRSLPECPDGAPIGISVERRRRRGGAKRPPSEYNLFMASCIRGRPEGVPVKDAMRGCAAKYRQRKSERK